MALPSAAAPRSSGQIPLLAGAGVSPQAAAKPAGQGNKTYLVLTSLIGLAAATAGVLMLVAASGTGLTVVVAAMAVLWLIATIHHSLLAKTRLPPSQVNARRSTRHGPRPAGAR